MIRVLIVDYQELARRSIQALPRRSPDMESIGEARDGREAVELAERLEPDVICMDIKMPHLDGLGATSQILAHQSNARVLIVAMSYDERIISQTMKNGAKGYVAKSDMFDELVGAIRQVQSGKPYLSAQIAHTLDESGHDLSKPEE